MAGSVLIMIPIGIAMGRVGKGPLQDTLYTTHKSFGILILGLMIWRSRKLFTRRARKVQKFSAHLAEISGQVEERGS